MRLCVIIVLYVFGNIRAADCQGSAEDAETEFSTRTWSSDCNDQYGNCKQDGDGRDDTGKDEMTETDEFEDDIYSEYDPEYGDYITLANDDAFRPALENEEVNDENTNLEEPIEEVEPFSHRAMIFPSDASEWWASESIQENLQELQHDEYPVEEECEPIPEKRKQRHGRKREKWKGRKRTNMILKDCCMKGKRIGLRAHIYNSDNLFRACRDTVRYAVPRVAYRCQRIMQTCCENKALRRYYIHNKRPSG